MYIFIYTWKSAKKIHDDRVRLITTIRAKLNYMISGRFVMDGWE